ncbi:Phospholipase [Meloidogyne graminicola]|uniref:Phospholipase n=1 Tax=Meloidogyne graminicola TaxID=189291 RepID=A0A8S9ZLR9_9BILA|nr:Phospholipase [Meloidogyne graminicola]
MEQKGTNISRMADTNFDYNGSAEELKTISRRRRGYIPYSTIYERQSEVRKNGYWIPGLPVEATIINVQRDTSTGYHILNPFIYTIELEHGRYKWRVLKRYQDFSYLSSRLMAHRAAEIFKAPVRRARHRIEEVIENATSDDEEKQTRIPTVYPLLQLSKSRELDDYNDGYCIADSTWETSGVSNNTTSIERSSVDNSLSQQTPLKIQSANQLPHFPVLPDSVLVDAQMQERAKRLEKWLSSVLAIPINREYHETAEFLDVSRYSFINELGGKYKEGKVKKRPGGNKVYIGCKKFCLSWLLPWSKRWLMVKDTYVAYMDPSNEQIRLVLLFDEQFQINSHELLINTSQRSKEFVVSNLQHVLMLKCSTEEDTQAWVDIIKNCTEENSGQIWLLKKRYGSSFPQRLNSYCQWFVDAKDCWEKVSSLIEMAREEIFIADWWLSPEIFLRRPMAEGNHWRLDYTLKRKAEKGVRIFVLVYKEMEMALGLKSLYSKKLLQGLHPNIKVMRHPDHYLGSGTFFWAHHEKLLVIDQLIAFVGGIDFCYGRWDASTHLLTDLGSVQFADQTDKTKVSVTNKDGFQEIKLIEEHETSVKEKDENIKIVERTVIEKPSQNGRFKDAMHRAVEKIRFNRSRETTPIITSTNISNNFSVPEEVLTEELKNVPPNIRFSSFTGNLSALEEHDSTSITNEDTRNSELIGIEKMDKTDENKRNSIGAIALLAFPMEPKQRTLVRRVVSNLRPERAKRRWRLALQPSEETHDEYIVNYCRLQDSKVDISGLQGAGKLWPGKDYVNFVHKDFVDVDIAFSDFINRYDKPRMPWHDIHSIVYGSAARDVARHFIQRWNAVKTEKLKNNSDYPYLVPKSYNSIRVPKIFFSLDTQRVEVQVLRSVSHWSTLIDKTEDSIQQNQFFVSLINSTDVSNEICRVLCDRIIRAHRENETFRVFILIPLLPGFEGDIGATSYSALLAVLHWTMLSIAKGEHSLVENLRKGGVDNVQKYISFCSLRTWDLLYGKMVGNRDSEICLLITDHEFIDSQMNNQPYKAGKFASSLRKRLMMEHLGLLEGTFPRVKAPLSLKINLEDPICHQFYEDIWCKIAESNTRIYEEVFRVFPTNLVETFDELLAWREENKLANDDQEAAKEQLSKLVGFLVEFPVHFLRKENLSPTLVSKEGLVSSSIFT